jgi:hypothetical protein
MIDYDGKWGLPGLVDPCATRASTSSKDDILLWRGVGNNSHQIRNVNSTLEISIIPGPVQLSFHSLKYQNYIHKVTP